MALFLLRNYKIRKDLPKFILILLQLFVNINVKVKTGLISYGHERLKKI